ncbi:MAG: 16S rRNA (adenine(1518)-N(6)/adenine(1519)-N(6)) -dimethyltransferase RsmA [Synechococcales cyanobacterium]
MPHPRKRFAQHWLKDARIHQAIVDAAALPRDPAEASQTVVLEIGPGTGQLTRRLLNQGVRVVAVEIDRDLCAVLRRQLAENPRFELVEGDFLRMPLPESPRFVVANIPYNITAAILERLLGSPSQPQTHFQRIVLLVQKEVAERLSAAPGAKAYGAMSVRIQYLAEVQWVCLVPRRAFYPPPQVESAVIVIQPRPYPTPARDPHWFQVLVQQGFSTRRKTLANCLQALVPKEQVSAALTQLQRDPLSRAETLSVEEWVQLSHLLQRGAVESIELDVGELDVGESGAAASELL